MASQKISNEMIYELLQAQGRRIDDHHDLLKDTREEMKEMRREQHHQGQRLRQVEDKIDGIRITWSTRLVSGRW